MKRTICVYAGSSSRVDHKYLDEARHLGALCAAHGIDLVCGGGRGGLMAALIEGCTQAGGHITGVLPDFMMDREWNHTDLSECVVTDSMHTRKERMIRDADIAVALPGGIGTFEELLEAMTWRQLKLFKGKVAVMDYDGFYQPLLDMLTKATKLGFMRKSDGGRLFHVVSDADDLLALLDSPDSV